MTSKILFALFVVISLIDISSCSPVTDISNGVSSSAPFQNPTNRQVSVILPDDMKMKMKMKMKAPFFALKTVKGNYSPRLNDSSVTNWTVTAVTADGRQYPAATFDQATFTMDVPMYKSYFLYIGQIVGAVSNIRVVGFGSNGASLPMRPNKNGANDYLDLGPLKVDADGSLQSTNAVFSALDFTPTSNAFDRDGDGVADFAGAVDRNNNGIPDAFETASGVGTNLPDSDGDGVPNLFDMNYFELATNTKTGDYYYFASALAADSDLGGYKGTPVLSNFTLVFALDTNCMQYQTNFFPSAFTNTVVEIVMDDAWRNLAEMNHYDSNVDSMIGQMTNTNSAWNSAFTNFTATNVFVVTNTNTAVLTNFLSNFFLTSNYSISSTNFIISNRHDVYSDLFQTNVTTNLFLLYSSSGTRYFTNQFWTTNWWLSDVTNTNVSFTTNLAGGFTNVTNFAVDITNFTVSSFFNVYAELVQTDITTNMVLLASYFATNYFTNLASGSTNFWLAPVTNYAVFSNTNTAPFDTNVFEALVNASNYIVTNIINSNTVNCVSNLYTNAVFVSSSTNYAADYTDTNSQTNLLGVLTAICVSTNGSDLNTGKAAAPMLTIQLAIAKALMNGITNVNIGEGVYTPGSGLNAATNGVLITNNNLNIIGGWNAGFTGQSGYSELDGTYGLYHIMVITNCDNMRLVGFVIRNGNAIGAATIDKYGGGLYIKVNDSLISNCVISNCFSSSSGSGIYMLYSTNNVMTDIACSSNNYTAVYVTRSYANSLFGTVTSNCSIGASPGGLYIYRSDSNHISGVFSYNQGYYGGIQMSGSSGNIMDGIVSYNSATYEGGGMTVSGSSNNIFNCFISNNSNSGSYSGGGIYIAGSYLNIFNGIVYGNYSSADGGGIYLSSSTSNTIACAVISNSCLVSGGGICIYNSGSGNTVNGGFNWNTSTNATLDIQDSTNVIIQVSMTGNSSIYGYVGLISVYNVNGLQILNSTITNNTAGSKWILDIGDDNFVGSLVISNCVFGGTNNSDDYAIWENDIFNMDITDHVLMNNTFLTNSLGYLYYDYGGAHVVTKNAGWTNVNDPAWTGATADSTNNTVQ